MQYEWSNIQSCPSSAGVYAWYYAPDITAFDIDKIVSEIIQLKSENNIQKISQLVEQFIVKRIYGYFRSEPYQVNLSGQLMPPFKGAVENELTVSPSLIERIIVDPKRLHKVRSYLVAAAPLFSSPLYIGKSDNLKTRLSTHKTLILKYRNDKTDLGSIQDSEENSFAIRVVKRGLPPERLFVVVHCIPKDDDNIHVDIEHIFNRICYPILGRN